jgi:hypothetical protein
MKFYDDTNSLILNLALHLVNPVAARLVFFFLSVLRHLLCTKSLGSLPLAFITIQ